MAPRWLRSLFISARVIIAAILFSAEVATAVICGHELTNTELAVLLAIANAVSIVMTAMVPDIRALWVSTRRVMTSRGAPPSAEPCQPRPHMWSL